MVVRRPKKSRKFLGTRRWGLGNIKNGRGKGDRGGVGKGGRKHKWTQITAKSPETIRKKGFHRWGAKKYDNMNLDQISKILISGSHSGEVLELGKVKVLSNGTLSGKVTIRALSFSKRAEEKIKAAGGEAVLLNSAA
ncbi:MAG: uL15 family ribosomal protein [Candidatus Marsarchaeota archaeon]|jgi:large subunit ribosomal protein L15|nr:uL15 family ribosomal protein [Candidatus Marsarchaeota archaeon]